jgi:predicted esterase
MRFLHTLLALSLFGIASAKAQGFTKTEFKDSDGTRLRYAILKPAKIKPAKIKPDTKYPLVVTLHGIGGRGSQKWEDNCAANKVLSQPTMRQKYPCYIIAPTVDHNQWWDGAPLAALTELIKSSLKKHPIDPARIYVTGQSMGGVGTYSAILKEPHLFAAAVPVCGRGQTDLAKKIVDLPIWIFHGANDQLIPTRHSREMVEALKKVGGKPIYTEYAGVGHGSWAPAYAEAKLWTWLFTQKRKTVKPVRPGVPVHGRHTAWHDNGQKGAEGEFKSGKEQGRWTYWNKDGSIDNEKSGIYKAGKKIEPAPKKWTSGVVNKTLPIERNDTSKEATEPSQVDPGFQRRRSAPDFGGHSREGSGREVGR